MIDIRLLREKPDIVRKSEKKRGKDPEIVDRVLELDDKWKRELKKKEDLNHKRNTVSIDISNAKKNKDEKLAHMKIKQMREIIDTIKEQEDKAGEMLRKRNEELKRIGNILHESVPKGKDESENVELKKVGALPKFGFPIKDHIEIGRDLDLIDIDTASRISGARFYFLKNAAVLLDMALQRYAIDKLMGKGYKLVYPPFMLNRAALEGGVNLSEFEDTIYKIENEDLYLIGTSEHPLVALKKDQVIEEKDLPIRIAGVSTCFRKEAGSHGRDTKGIFRVHQFNKVEQVVYCRPEESYKHFEEMQRNSEEMLKELGIPFRVVNICTGDLGNKQALQYDIEAWFPGQNEKKGAYRELGSCSNCTDYQAVTLNTRFSRKDGSREYVHMLNNTAIATTRAMAAIMENFQRKDGSVTIPKVLMPYMNGMKEINASTL